MVRRLILVKLLMIMLAMQLSTVASAQVIKPISWTYSVKDSQLNVGDQTELIFRADIDKNWYLYSSDFDPDLGPMVTEFEFVPDPGYELVGDIKPINPSKKYDEIFEGDYTYFKGTGEFRQTIKVLSPEVKISGGFSYQVCSDIDGKCIPFDEEFDESNFAIEVNSQKNGKELPPLSENSEPTTSSVPVIPSDDSPQEGLIAQDSGSGILQPASWNIEIFTENYNVGDTVELAFNVDIDKNWYLYSNDFDPDLGPLVTEFDFKADESYAQVGGVVPVEPLKSYDEIFEGEYTYFKGKGTFIQRVKVNDLPLVISGSVRYQVCSDIDGKCINFEEDFSLLKEGINTGERKDPTKELSTAASASKTSILNQRDPNDPYSLLGFFFIAFMAGLAALLTPCVFPMIPVTVTFFTRSGRSRGEVIRNASLYGLSIILFFTILGLVVSFVFGAEVMNDVATSATANIIFFLIFTIFGLSFLGLFEINLPSSFINKVDRQADKGGFIGILFMALTLVVVSFSCTGPIVGSILVESAGGQILKPTIGMLGFSLAFAIPFTLFAVFPETLNKLPKSGGWLNSIKVVLGFLELALALKFLSIADQVYHWGILNRDVYIALWVVIFTLMAFYLLGKIRLPNDSKLEIISVPRLVLAILTFAFVTYLLPGMFGAPLKILSGYLPPITTQEFDLAALIRQNQGSGSYQIAENESVCDNPKYADFLKFPHGIKGYFDYEQALNCASNLNKPLFIDFTGHGCVNCREMEARVWSDPEVLKRLKNDFVMVALYVDDKKELPEDEWYRSTYDGKLKKTIGKQNADLQITKFNNNAQPFYVILDNEGELLIEPEAYNLDINEFISFLDEAKRNFYNENTLARE